MITLTSVNTLKTEEDAASLDTYLTEIAQRNAAALASLYDCTSASVYSFALSILKNVHDAEDVLHDCYVTIYAAAEGYHPAGKPMAWILTITRNLCLQKIRERQKTTDLPPEDWERYLDTRDDVSCDDKLVIAACMNRLSDEERQIVVLHAVAGFKHREISALADLPLSTVLSKYNRALKKLKTFLSEERS